MGVRAGAPAAAGAAGGRGAHRGGERGGSGEGKGRRGAWQKDTQKGGLAGRAEAAPQDTEMRCDAATGMDAAAASAAHTNLAFRGPVRPRPLLLRGGGLSLELLQPSLVRLLQAAHLRGESGGRRGRRARDGGGVRWYAGGQRGRRAGRCVD